MRFLRHGPKAEIIDPAFPRGKFTRDASERWKRRTICAGSREHVARSERVEQDERECFRRMKIDAEKKAELIRHIQLREESGRENLLKPERYFDGDEEDHCTI